MIVFMVWGDFEIYPEEGILVVLEEMEKGIHNPQLGFFILHTKSE